MFSPIICTSSCYHILDPPRPKLGAETIQPTFIQNPLPEKCQLFNANHSPFLQIYHCPLLPSYSSFPTNYSNPQAININK